MSDKELSYLLLIRMNIIVYLLLSLVNGWLIAKECQYFLLKKTHERSLRTHNAILNSRSLIFKVRILVVGLQEHVIIYTASRRKPH